MLNLQKLRIKRAVTGAIASIFFSTQLFLGVLGSGIVHADTLDEEPTQTQSTEVSSEDVTVTETPENTEGTVTVNSSLGQTTENTTSVAEQQTELATTNNTNQPNNVPTNVNQGSGGDNNSNRSLPNLLDQQEVIIQVVDPNVTLCHATGSETNPFEEITVDAAGAFSGHLGVGHQLGEDIIPTFTYNGQTYSQNWDAEGQAIHENNCVVPDEPDPVDPDVTLCHATGSETNPYIRITIDAAGAFNGHLGLEHQLGEDIIPPFTYNGQTYSQNWDAEGQATFNNNCVRVNDVCPNIEGLQTTVPEGMVKNQAGNCVTPVVVLDDNVTLCHATGSTTNPFVIITVSAAGAFNGHLGIDHQNGEDIIPPFTFNGQTYSQNWDATGQATFNNGCVPVPPRVVVTTEGGRGGGAVLGASTTQPAKVAAVAEQLVNTGTHTLNTIFAALVLIGLAAATAFSSPKYRSDPGLSTISY